MRATLFLSAFPLLSFSAFSAESFPAANGLERTLVAEQPLLKNPVSVSVDVDGTIYVTETARRKEADLDIREFVKFGWVPRDVSHTSIEDKRAFFQQQLDGKNSFKGTSLKDQNKDGKIDVKDLTAISEKIIRLTDKDGDGAYDTSNVFAEGFNTEVTGIAAGVLAWRGDVYTTIAPDVWKLRDTDGDGKADKRESLAHGFGIHIAYAGHDMHGLIPGPDGKLYWSIGDKGTNVTGKDGKKHYAPHEGAVLRCNPDGSGFEIFARGLRNPQEIAFDKYGNLFSVDNDADFKGERERFLHITEGSDTGWRNYYQYRGSAYNPWMAESIWEPSGEHQPAYITPTSGNYSDGPSGFAYNPGTALNAKYADLIRKNPDATVPAARRSIAANRYLADAESVARLADYASDESVETSLRIAALEALASWTEASEPNPVDGRHDPLKPADAALAKAAYQPHAAVLWHHRDKAISKAAAAVSKNLGITLDPEEMKKDILNPKADLATRLRGLDSLAASREKADRAALAKILPQLLKDKSAPLRTRAAALIAELDPAAFTAYAEAALARSTDIPERQQAVRLLAKIKPDALKPLLAKPAEHPTLLIELSEAFPEVKLDPKTASLTGGDAELGEIVFNENLAAQCVACHRVEKEGSEVGPPLTEIGKKGREYILESLLDPQAKIAPGYGMMSVKMKDGSTFAGALKEEKGQFLTLILPDKKEVVINLTEIESRTAPVSTMPPMGAILTPRQLRDLVEYLSGLKT